MAEHLGEVYLLRRAVVVLGADEAVDGRPERIGVGDEGLDVVEGLLFVSSLVLDGPLVVAAEGELGDVRVERGGVAAREVLVWLLFEGANVDLVAELLLEGGVAFEVELEQVLLGGRLAAVQLLFEILLELVLRGGGGLAL